MSLEGIGSEANLKKRRRGIGRSDETCTAVAKVYDPSQQSASKAAEYRAGAHWNESSMLEPPRGTSVLDGYRRRFQQVFFAEHPVERILDAQNDAREMLLRVAFADHAQLFVAVRCGVDERVRQE